MDSLDAMKFLGQLASQLHTQAEQVSQWQARLQQNEENQEWSKLESLLASAQTFIFSTDQHLQITGVQGPMTECLGWSEPEFVGHELQNFIDPSCPTKSTVLKELSEVTSTRIELPFLSRTGVRLWFHLTIVPLQCEDGNHAFQIMACGVQEIQNRSEELRLQHQRMSEQLEVLQREQQQRLDENTSTPVDQEFWFRLRSTLRSIILGRMRVLFSQAEQGASPATLRGLSFGVDFLENLLRLEVKPENWRELEDFQPARLFNDCLGLFQTSAINHNLPSLTSVSFLGPIRVWQAFLLELFAWRESTVSDANFDVQLQLDGQSLALTAVAKLEDEGRLEDCQRRSRQHFSRLKRLCEACRGELSLKKGTSPNEIVVVLHLTGGVQPETIPPSAPPQEPQCYSILVAEDDEIAKRVVVTLLQKLGHHVQAVSGGLDVLELLNVQEFDVVLLDLEMPDLDGISTARQIISRLHPPPYLIALTAGNSASIRRQVMEAGMHDFLSKPLRSDELNDALSQVQVHRLSRDGQA
jgi:CheY-like chemotaxis protein